MPKNPQRRPTPVGDRAVLIGGLLAVLLAVAFGAPRTAASTTDVMPLAILDCPGCGVEHQQCCVPR